MQKSSINYILGSDSLTVYLEGKSYTINKQAHTYGIVLEAVKTVNVDALKQALDVKKTITSMLSNTSDKVRIENNKIFYMDREVQGLISSRIFEMLRLELDVKPMVLFLENLMSNPSKRAVDELFGFLEACTLPITPDGCFLAYKRVRDDYLDCHSGTMDNSVGKVLEMPRNMVDEDKNNTCSYGLHFCSYDYLKSFSGARIVVLKINPKDVVAIPADYNNSKGRTCKYEVVDEIALNEYNLPSTMIQDSYVDDYYEDPDDVLDISDTEVNPVVNQGKLTDDHVRSIRDLLAHNKWSIREIADAYEVSSRTIGRIRDGISYKRVI